MMWSTVALILVQACSVHMISDIMKEKFQILNSTFEHYDVRIPPVVKQGEPIVNTIQLYILSIDSVSNLNMDYSMNFYLRQHWRDTRLNFTSDNFSRLELDTAGINRVWVPDLYIINEKEAEYHDVTVPNKLFHIYPDGSVLYSSRISGTFSVTLQLNKFPFDSQIFTLEMSSYGYSDDTLLFQWQNPPVVLSPNIEVAQFQLRHTEVYTCDAAYLDNMNFSCVGLKLYLDRKFGYYIIQIYIPSVLIVLMSWISFWLAEDATPARVSLGILTVLTMTAQFSDLRANLARVSYVKSIDIWMAACLSFVFLAIIEFAFVNLVSRTGIDVRAACSRDKDAEACQDVEEKQEKCNGKVIRKPKRGRATISRHRKAVTIDRVARILFPSCFVFFNFIYWFLGT